MSNKYRDYLSSVSHDGTLSGSGTSSSPLSVSRLGLVADWPITTVRTFLWDPVNGNDSNAGYSDAAGPYNPATQARKTTAGMRAIIPTDFAGRKFRLLMAAGTYTEGLDQVLAGASGIGVNSLIRGTATNATAGCTAFDDSAADRICQGWTTATGMNAAGYKPTGVPTTTTIQCLTAGGGAPGFSGDPALPAGARIRFDAATPTAALRNVCRTITQVTGTDTLTGFDSALPTPPVAGSDVFYIEMGGLALPAHTLQVTPTGILSTLQICGITSTGAVTLSGGDFRLTGAKVNQLSVTLFSSLQQQTGFIEPTTGSTVAIGGIVRSDTTAIYTRGTFASLQNGTSYTVTQLGSASVLNWSASTMACNSYSGGAGNDASSVSGRVFGVLGSSATLLSAPTQFTNLTCTGAGAHPAIAFNSFVRQGYTVTLANSGSITGSTGNTDVGFDCTGATGCTFILAGPVSVTGTLGDVRVAGGQILTWAQVGAGFVDKNGNRFVSVGTANLYPTGLFSGVLKNGGGAAVSTFAANYSAGQTANQATAQQYPTSPRFITKLRLCAPSGTPADSSLTATLYKGGVATAMTCTIAANQAAGSKASDTAHPITFADGDTFDVKVNGASASDIPFTATIEGP